MNLLGIDYGTTSVKATLFDGQLNEITSTARDYTLISKGDTVEFDAEAYFDMLVDILAEVSKAAKVDALSIDTQCETLILTDNDGKPLRNAIVWLDNRAAREAVEIEKIFGHERVYEITGQPEITATWPACKLKWVKKNEPDIFKSTKKIFLLEDYLLYKLTGNFVTEKTLQSSTIYFDIRNGCWWKEMLDEIGVEESMLPELKNSGEIVGEYNGIKVVTSAMDQVAGAIGAGVIKKGIASEMTGTTMVVLLPTDKIPEYDAKSIVPCHYNYDNSYCLLAWPPTAGMALKWFKNAFFADKSFKELDEMAEKVPIGCGGLTFLPYLCGSTMPKYNPNARGSFTGLTQEHTAGHFVRSIMEAVSCMLKENLDYLNLPVSEIRAMGGGANSSLWCRMKADITGKTLCTLENNETACLGSAILAGLGTGLFESVDAACSMAVRIKDKYTPSGADYEAVYKAYKYADGLLNK